MNADDFLLELVAGIYEVQEHASFQAKTFRCLFFPLAN